MVRTSNRKQWKGFSKSCMDLPKSCLIKAHTIISNLQNIQEQKLVSQKAKLLVDALKDSAVKKDPFFPLILYLVGKENIAPSGFLKGKRI